MELVLGRDKTERTRMSPRGVGGWWIRVSKNSKLKIRKLLEQRFPITWKTKIKENNPSKPSQAVITKNTSYHIGVWTKSLQHKLIRNKKSQSCAQVMTSTDVGTSGYQIIRCALELWEFSLSQSLILRCDNFPEDTKSSFGFPQDLLFVEDAMSPTPRCTLAGSL